MDVSDIFIFFCSGRGKGESEAPGRGGGFGCLLKMPGGGGSPGREGLGGCLRRIEEFWGGGLNIFFSGAKCPPSKCRGYGLTLPYREKKHEDDF